MFICDKCGLCCMNVDKLPIYGELDRGDGICRYFDCKSKLCTIYENRPDICNVDKTYNQIFSKYMSRDEYYSLNYKACQMFKDSYLRGKQKCI